MKCIYCGEISEDGIYCSNCGKINQVVNSDTTYVPSNSVYHSPHTKNRGIFSDPAKKAEKNIRIGAVASMTICVIFCLILGSMGGYYLGNLIGGLFVGTLLGVLLCIVIRNSVLYKLAIMQTCKTICEYIEMNSSSKRQ